MTKLNEKVAVVTGSSTGIGRAIAQRLLDEGASVVVNSRNEIRAKETAEALDSQGRAFGVGADISNPEGAAVLADAAVDRFGRIDIWVSNAGINAVEPSLTIDPNEYRKVIDVNLNGCFYGAQAAGRVMVPRECGVIIQIGSLFSQTAFPMRAAYAAAKHGLVGLLKVLSTEWAKDGVRVMNIDPGYIEATGQGYLDPSSPGYYTNEQIEGRTPMGRFGTADEIAGVVAFLASDDAGYMTGSSVAVDGGWLAYGGW